jgi:hypothetical protein
MVSDVSQAFLRYGAAVFHASMLGKPMRVVVQIGTGSETRYAYERTPEPSHGVCTANLNMGVAVVQYARDGA